LITAAPGGGKSTLLNQLAAEAAAWWLESACSTSAKPDASPCGMTVPVRVSAQTLVGRSLPDAIATSVVNDLAEYMDMPAPPSDLFARQPMPDVDWLVMVDGLDEILDRSRRAKVIDSLASRARQKKGPFRLLIVSRPLPEVDLSNLNAEIVSHYVLEEIDDERLKSYVYSWFATRLPSEAEQRSTQFLKLIDQNNLQSVVALPLLATIALIIFEQADSDRPTLPTGRTGLYTEFARYLLQVREDTAQTRAALQTQLSPYAHGPKAADWIYENLTPLLEYLAFKFLSGKSRSLVELAHTWIQERCPNPINGIPDITRIIPRLLSSTGLLIERGTEIDFLHRSFAEYLAAGQVADQLPDQLARGGAGEFLTSIFQVDDYSCALFAIGRWWHAKKARSVTHLIETLLEGNHSDVLFAADIITFEVRTRAGLEKQLADVLLEYASRSRERWLESLDALASLPDRDDVLPRLAKLARGSGYLGQARIRAARKLADLGKRQSSIEILTQMAKINLYRGDWADAHVLDSDFCLPVKSQDLMRRLELADIDEDDADGNIVYMTVRSLGSFAGALSEPDDPEEPDPAAILDEDFIDDSFISDLEPGIDLLICAAAAWELADMGEISLAMKSLLRIAYEEYRTSSRSEYYVSLPVEYGFWANVDESPLTVRILSEIALARSVQPAVRLSAAFALGSKLSGKSVALRCLRRLAEDRDLDYAVRLESAQALSYLGDPLSAERIFASIAGDSVVEVRTRLQACRSLAQFDGENAAVIAICRIAEDADLDPEDRLAAAFELPGSQNESIRFQTLIEVARNPNVEDDTRLWMCRKLAEQGKSETGIKIMRTIAASDEELLDVRISAARGLYLIGDIQASRAILMKIYTDPRIHAGARAMALQQLNRLNLG
jgi:hypothetical protein